MTPVHLEDPMLVRALQSHGDSSLGLDAKLSLLAERRRISEEESARTDRLLIETMTATVRQLDEVRQATSELMGVQNQLRDMIETLTSPPLMEACFLGTTRMDGEELAIVSEDGSRRLVRLTEGLSISELARGEIVYLTKGGGVILGHDAIGRPMAGEIGTVRTLLEGNRLVLEYHGEEVIVSRGRGLSEETVTAGDRIVWDASTRIAVEVLPSAADTRWFLRELPDVGRTAVAGLSHERDRIIDRFILGITHAELAAMYGMADSGTLLLHGPPGCGKTTLMRVIVSELGRVSGERCRVAVVNGSELESPWVGETQRNIRNLFRELAAGSGPKVLFVDEVDAIARHRGGAVSQHNDKFLSTWLTEIDGLRRLKDVAIIAATNRKDLMDAALLERLSAMELFVPRPSMSAAREILRLHLPQDLPFSPNGAAATGTREELVETAVELLYAPNAPNQLARLRFRDSRERIVTAKDLVSGRVFQQICATARGTAFRRHAQGGTAGLCLADVEAAVDAALDRMATLLTPRNARSHIADLPDDVEVLAVDRLRTRVRSRLVRAPSPVPTSPSGRMAGGAR
jgi:ATP-dependent 26S proteasome regulatory subunit